MHDISQKSPFTFLQVSDIHLDSKLNSSRLSMPPGKRKQRANEIFQALENALQLAKQRAVDVILIPGDLWDSENISSKTVNKIIELTSETNIPIIIAPGNHDYCGKDSFYHQHTLTSRAMLTWPQHVHIFDKPDFQTFTLNEEISVTGRAFSGNVLISDRLLSTQIPKNENSPINLLLFHGSLDGYTGKDAMRTGKITAPFSVSELESLKFTYAAVGHFHDYTEIHSSGGALIGAYSGCLVGRGLDEAGPHFAVIGTIESGTVKLEKIEIDKRRVIKTNCDITNLSTAEMVGKINKCLEQSGARSPEDIVYLEVTGNCSFDLSDSLDKIAPYYHLAVDDNTRPNYCIDNVDLRTTEGKFINAIMEMKRKIQDNGQLADDTASGDSLSLDTLDDALYYGLDALKHKKVMLRHVD